MTEEGAEIMKEFEGAPALDADLLSAAQSVERYEIARYGTLKRLAEQLGLEEAVGDAGRGKEHRPSADRACRGDDQRAGGVGRIDF
jgi:hypothetical protein